MNINDKKIKMKKIIVLGGYGIGNVGDEAQLNANIEMLQKEFPKSMIKVLTPNESYTYIEHNGCLVGLAPRIAFYDKGKSGLYGITNKNSKTVIHFTLNEIRKLHFLLRSYWLMLNAILIKHNLPSFLLRASRVSLLYELKTSDMVFFSGGGYLTGKTLSRLWDGMFFIRMAAILEVPVVLSGQTIGVWSNRINKHIAKFGLRHAKVVTCRDPEASINALKEIGMNSNKYFVTCDDALYCEKENDESIVNSYLTKSEIDMSKDYIVMNIHYWGIDKKEEKNKLLEKINLIVQAINKHRNFQILFIPMTFSDETTIDDYMSIYRENNIFKFKYNYNFRIIRSVISKSQICVTMKHHPIIFALGEVVPVISLSQFDYYLHKNVGALKIFGLDKLNIELENESYLLKFEKMYLNIFDDIEALKEQISCSHKKIKESQKSFKEALHTIINKES